MPRYWVIAPFASKQPEVFDKVWQFDLENDLISLGWAALGDVSEMSRDALLEAVAATYPEKPPQTQGLTANMIWAFYHEIRPGHYVIARRGRKTLAAVGHVTQPASYTPGKHAAPDHPSVLEIAWQPGPRNKAFESIVFPMHTLAEITEEQFRTLTDGAATEAVLPPEAEGLEDPSEFVLERYLEDFVVTNLASIFRGALELYEDAEGNDGQQYSTDIGPIDILAIEKASGSLVVIELKKGRSSDAVVGQILRYMGWVKKHLCSDGQAVRGLIICREPDARLSYAVEMADHIDVRYYSVSFTLSEAR